MNGTVFNIEQYFRRRYQYSLQYPDLFTVQAGKNKEKAAVYPAECCRVQFAQRPPGRDFKPNEQQTAEMLKKVCRAPQARLEYTRNLMAEARVGNDVTTMQFRISTGKDLLKAQAVIMPHPTISYGNKSLKPTDGVWKPERENVKFVEAKLWGDYALINIGSNPISENHLVPLMKLFWREAEKFGMTKPVHDNIFPAKYWHVPNPSELKKTLVCFLSSLVTGTYDREVEEYYNKTGGCQFNFVLVLMPRKDQLVYSRVKQLCDVERGLPSQCLLYKNAGFSFNGQPSSSSPAKWMTVQNVLLKLNAKLGGRNWRLDPNDKIYGQIMADLKSTPTLLLGIDVAHASVSGQRDEQQQPSCWAVAGNVDIEPFQFAASFGLNMPNEETLDGLMEAVVDRVGQLQRLSNCPVRRVIVYRDGVGEDFANKYLGDEVETIHRALAAAGAPDADVTMLVCVKQHHTRFFPQDKKDVSGRAGNVPPGALIDASDPCHPTQYDFYLCSHFGIQGTSVPSYYKVVYSTRDDWRPRELERLTFALSHLYARCPRSVSIPAPAYYAHLACTRARDYVFNIFRGLGQTDFNAWLNIDKRRRDARAAGKRAKDPNYEPKQNFTSVVPAVRRFFTVHDQLQARLFYC